MKRRKLTCNEAREYSIEKALANLGHFPSSKSEKEAWYLSPFRSENQASFKVSLVLNRWYDHGLGKGGNVIDLIIALKSYSIPQVLDFLDNDRVDFSFHQPALSNMQKSEKTYEIVNIKKLEHKALLDYLKKRCIDLGIAQQYCKEIHYKIKGKKYFAIAFENCSNGYTIRNRFIKGNLLNKDVSILKNNSNKVCVFEGFIDFLSYLTLFKKDKISEDFIILNSVSSVKKIPNIVKKYQAVYTYLDNDDAGKDATIFLQKNHQNLIQCNEFYKGFNDLNECLMSARVY